MTTHPVNELQSAEYSATLKDETGAVVPAASITSAKLTLFDLTTGTVINSRDNQNVLNINDVTISAGGVLVWAIRPADNAIVTPGSQYETHIALFVVTWQSGAKQITHDVHLKVRNLNHLP